MSRLRSARRHLREYAALARWLWGNAFRWHARTIIVSGFLSAMGVVTEFLAFMFILKALHALEGNSLEPAGNFSAMFHVSTWHPVFLVGAPTLAFALAGLIAYRGRVMAIVLQQRFARRLSEDILSRISRGLNGLERFRPPFGLDQGEVTRVVLGDTYPCGVAVRLSLLHSIGLIYLAVGFLIVARMAPVLLLLWLGVAVVTFPIMYAVNLAAIRDARALPEDAAAHRRSEMSRIRAMFGSQDTDAVTSDPATGDRYENALTSRLRILETSRFILSLVFALTIAALLWIAHRAESKAIFGFANIALLFIGFRYIFMGIQGLSTLITSINRFLPAILRVVSLDRRAKMLERRAAAITKLRSSRLKIGFDWHLLRPDGIAEGGRFQAGTVYAVALVGRFTPSQAGQLLTIIERKSMLGFLAAVGEQPVHDLDSLTTERTQQEIAGLSPDSKTWLDAALDAEGHGGLAAGAIDANDEGAARQRFIATALALDELGRLPPRVILLKADGLLKYKHDTIRRLLQRLRKHLVFVLGRGLYVTVMPIFDGTFISTGVRIGMVLPASSQVDESMSAKVREIFGSEHVSAAKASSQANVPLDVFDEQLI